MAMASRIGKLLMRVRMKLNLRLKEVFLLSKIRISRISRAQ